MGKKRKIRTGAGDIVPVPGPLHKQIEKSIIAKQKFKMHNKQQSRSEIKDIEFVDSALSTKILRTAQKQWDEVAREEGEDDDYDGREDGGDIAGDEEEGEVEDELKKHAKDLSELDLDSNFDEQQAFGKSTKAEDHDHEATAKPEKLLHFNLAKQQRKLREKKAKEAETGEDELAFKDLDPSIVALYREVGNVLASYRSGKVPKAFKILPSMQNWEQMLELTNPDKWSAGAMLEATKLFASTGTPVQCQRFNNLILLPRLRDDIDEYKKLNFHMFQCVFKAMFKPAAFFKGILLPLCRSGTCSVREAIVFGSALRRVSIPQMHAAAAMLSIAEMDFCNANSFILRVLIEKNYTLPFRALDGLVFNFLRMRNHSADLPVVWHQCLLSFVEKYAKDISSEQRQALIELTKVKTHPKISAEIQRILRATESRNEESEANIPDYAREEEERDAMDF